jgi:Response regulator containing CheY-like receiver, AAA-type ATPase, and DNA-binding domains
MTRRGPPSESPFSPTRQRKDRHAGSTCYNAPERRCPLVLGMALAASSRDPYVTPTGKIDGTGRKILVIDDDLAIRVLLQAVLRRMNFEVELAEDGAAGLEKVQQNGTFDLILLDLMMPRLNGYEFIAEMGKQFGDRRPHMIVFTAAGKRGVDKIPANAVCNSILKPFDLEKFIDMVGDCLNKTHEIR